MARTLVEVDGHHHRPHALHQVGPVVGARRGLRLLASDGRRAAKTSATASNVTRATLIVPPFLRVSRSGLYMVQLRDQGSFDSSFVAIGSPSLNGDLGARTNEEAVGFRRPLPASIVGCGGGI